MRWEGRRANHPKFLMAETTKTRRLVTKTTMLIGVKKATIKMILTPKPPTTRSQKETKTKEKRRRVIKRTAMNSRLLNFIEILRTPVRQSKCCFNMYWIELGNNCNID
mmetsp:Transcript_647/g.1329  ORF Transcript_647/g.1329 Transcript_647/m.1329 type:complete len:108 (-) Transcript_647:25-348(-)